MRERWTDLRLGDVLHLEYGRALPERLRQGGQYPVCGSAGVVGWHSEPLVPEKPMIVVGRKGSAGAIQWSDKPCWPIDTTYFVRLAKGLLPRFMYVLLQWLDLGSLSAQTGVPGLSRDRVYEIQVHLPSLAEQRRIADLAEAAESAIVRAAEISGATRVSLVRIREEWFERLWNNAPMSRMGDAVRRVRRPIAVQADATYKEIGVRSHGRGLFHKEAVRGSDLGNKAVFEIQPDDLVLNIVFAWESAVAVASLADAGRCGSHRFPTYRAREDVDIHYVLQALRSSRGVTTLSLASPGSAGRNRTLNQGMLMESLLPIPDISEQRLLVATLGALDFLADKCACQEKALASLRSALLSDLLSGDHEIPPSYDRFFQGAA